MPWLRLYCGKVGKRQGKEEEEGLWRVGGGLGEELQALSIYIRRLGFLGEGSKICIIDAIAGATW